MTSSTLSPDLVSRSGSPIASASKPDDGEPTDFDGWLKARSAIKEPYDPDAEARAGREAWIAMRRAAGAWPAQTSMAAESPWSSHERESQRSHESDVEYEP